MRRVRGRTIGFVIFALAISLVCVRLGIWQLSRLRERTELNASVASRLEQPPTSLEEALRDTASARFRRVVLRGRFDYEHDFFIANRTRSGSPGVHLVTPLRLADTNLAVLVVRGWVYSPDGATVDLARWREHAGADVEVAGFLDNFSPQGEAVGGLRNPRALRRLVHDSLAQRLPYPLAPKFVVQTSDSVIQADRPARLAVPALDEGSHRSYAVQWFAFALIGLVGVAFVLVKELRTEERPLQTN